MNTKNSRNTISDSRLKKSCALVVAGLLLLSSTSLLLAETLRSESYIIQFGNFNVTSGEKSSANYTITDTVGQIAPGEYDGTGYVVKAGFQYIYPFRSLSLKISKVTIDLGLLTAGSFNTDSHTIIVDTNGAGGYAVKTFESHPLRLQNESDTIRDTLCDSGTCSETTAGSWTTATNYGLVLMFQAMTNLPTLPTQIIFDNLLIFQMPRQCKQSCPEPAFLSIGMQQ